MSLEDVGLFPNWKHNATAQERLDEIRALAAKKPEQFSKLVVCWVEDKNTDAMVTRYITANCTTLETAGILDVAKQELYDQTRR